MMSEVRDDCIGQTGAFTLKPEVQELLEEAEADLEDAVTLVGTAGGEGMGVWHAGQSAEKCLRALLISAGKKAPVTWNLKRLYEETKGLEGTEGLEQPISELCEALAARASNEVLKWETIRSAIEASRKVRRETRRLFGEEVGEDPPLNLPVMVPQKAAPQAEEKEGPKGTEGPKGPRIFARSEFERRTSYVKKFLVCPRCGVRIPRKQQTARGKVPCPMCGKDMVLAE